MCSSSYKSFISSHLQNALDKDNVHRTSNYVLTELRKIDEKYPFEAIAVCGTSGLVWSGFVAANMNKNIIVVRKTDDKAYSSFKVEGVKDSRYLILDDLVCTWNTVNHIVLSINKYLCEYSYPVGGFFWNDGVGFRDTQNILSHIKCGSLCKRISQNALNYA